MIALILATQDEARPLLDRLAATVIPEQPFSTYAFPPSGNRAGGLVVISGMGPANAARAATYAISSRGAKRLINIGLCGALTSRLKPGDLCTVSSVLDGDALLQGATRQASSCPLHTAWMDLPSVPMVTVAQPVFGGPVRERLAGVADIVEMEGEAIARVAREQGVDCALIKGVSDFACEGGREALHRNLAAVATSLAETVSAGLEHDQPPRPSLPVRMLNFVKVEHTIFSLPLLFAGAWIGADYGWPGLDRLALVALAGLGARAFGMAMNRILDRHLDLLNPRTHMRDLPSGRLTLVQGWGVAIVGFMTYLVACYALGPICWRLAPIPAVVLTGYSLLKRFTSLCHFGIGLSLALGPLGAYVAVTGSTASPPALLMLALFTFCWISGSDILYALQDVVSDRETGIHSIPVALGPIGARWVAAGVHLTALIASVTMWHLTNAGLAGGVALAVTGTSLALMYNERWSLAVRFFPVSAIAGVAGALIPLFGGTR